MICPCSLRSVLLKPDRSPGSAPCFGSFGVSLLSGSDLYRSFAFHYLYFQFAALFQHNIRTEGKSLTGIQKQKWKGILNSSSCNPLRRNTSRHLSTLDTRVRTQTYSKGLEGASKLNTIFSKPEMKPNAINPTLLGALEENCFAIYYRF